MEVPETIVVTFVIYIMVSGDKIDRGLPPHNLQLSEEKTISIFPVLRDDISLDDGKGISIPRYLLHDGLEYPPSFMGIGKDGEAEVIRRGFAPPLLQGRPREGTMAFSQQKAYK